MAKPSRYQSKTPTPDGVISYSADEDAVWRDLMARQDGVLPGRVCDAFLAGLDVLDLPRDRVPQLAEISKKLRAASGFAVEPVPALITPERFFGLLAAGKFPAATFLRRREDFDYLQEPDVFHEVFGHCPLLTDPVYANFLKRFGRAALAAGPETLWMFQRLFWFTVEFGLLRTPEGLRIYGAGIASSAGESVYALEDPRPERAPFDLMRVLRTPYRIDILQPVYFVIEDWDQLSELVAKDLTPVMAQTKRLGPLPVPYPSFHESLTR
ncbi:MAG: phenylalanine 4-monooxygenase [Pseudomonadota bacterium]